MRDLEQPAADEARCRIRLRLAEADGRTREEASPYYDEALTLLDAQCWLCERPCPRFRIDLWF